MTGPTSGPLPGTMLLRIARLLFSEPVLSSVVQPTISDLQREMADAGATGRQRLRARWRGYGAFWKMVIVALFVPWPSPAEDAGAGGGAFPTGIARFAVASVAVTLFVIAGPVLGAFVAVLTAAGSLLAIVIHAWYDRHPSAIPSPAERRPSSPQINFSSTEVAGNVGGLIFVVGTVFIVIIGLPAVIWFLFAATVAGCCLAWALATWHTSHPAHGLPENRIVLR